MTIFFGVMLLMTLWAYAATPAKGSVGVIAVAAGYVSVSIVLIAAMLRVGGFL